MLFCIMFALIQPTKVAEIKLIGNWYVYKNILEESNMQSIIG